MKQLLVFLYSLFKNTEEAVIDLGVVLMIGIAFVGMIIVGFIIWRIRRSLLDTLPYGTHTSSLENSTYEMANSTMANITVGFDNAVALILVAITIFLLALAISALLLLRGKRQ